MSNKTCPYCGKEAGGLFRVPDGKGSRIACLSCKDDEAGYTPRFDRYNRPKPPGNDFLREVLTYDENQ